MIDTPETAREDAELRRAFVNTSETRIWFVSEVLPLEAALMQFLQRNWRNASDIRLSLRKNMC
jgi:hypothetical protein